MILPSAWWDPFRQPVNHGVVFVGITGDFGGRRKASEGITEHGAETSNDVEIRHWICLIPARFGCTNGRLAEELPLFEVTGACEGGACEGGAEERNNLWIQAKKTGHGRIELVLFLGRLSGMIRAHGSRQKFRL
ncbi:hypothetical protein U1Q18_044633 [Sarracenia purpurea var. burkii]